MPLPPPDLPPISPAGGDYGSQQLDPRGYPIMGGPQFQLNPNDPYSYGATYGPENPFSGANANGYGANSDPNYPAPGGGHTPWRPNVLLGGPLGVIGQIIRHAIESRIHARNLDVSARGGNPAEGVNPRDAWEQQWAPQLAAAREGASNMAWNRLNDSMNSGSGVMRAGTGRAPEGGFHPTTLDPHRPWDGRAIMRRPSQGELYPGGIHTNIDPNTGQNVARFAQGHALYNSFLPAPRPGAISGPPANPFFGTGGG